MGAKDPQSRLPSPISPAPGYHRDQVLMVLPLFQPAVVNVLKLGSTWEDSANSRVLLVPSVTSLTFTVMPFGAPVAARAALPVDMNMPSFVADVAKIGRLPPLPRYVVDP
ncbi:MAG: hypothetical protein FJ286_13790 [Planctomycetes bacterium]|nr:hypothetical protein [Planctomycetota bacterium]